MTIDFHLHVKLSKKSSFSIENFNNIIEEAKENGMTAITITEHFNTLNFHEVYDTLEKTYSYKNDYFEVNGIKAFTGMEVDIAENGHVLVIGNLKKVREIRKILSSHETSDCFIALETLLKLCSENSMLVIGSHPFRKDHPLYKVQDELLCKFDAFDLNGKDLFTYGIEEMKEKVMNMGNQYTVPVVTGSDTHQYLQLGCVMTEFEKDCTTVKEIKEEIAKGKYKIVISPCLKTKVKAATIIKKLLKEKLKV